MTSDGINDNDWSKVKESAAEICTKNVSEISDTRSRKKLMFILKKLEKKYGRLPSIISTRADYVGDTNKSLSLNKEAFISALEINDKKNIALISGAISELYIDELNDLMKGRYWITIFEESLSNFDDDYLNELFVELKRKLVR